MYNYDEIQNCLETKYVGQTFVQFEELKSTHQKAKNISSNCPDGMLVLSEFQENVKLKNNKYWYALNGDNIYLSIIFKTDGKSDYTTQMLQIANVSVLETLKSLDENINCFIKWPNDIYVDDKKICSTFSEYINKKDNSSLIVSIYMNISINEDEDNDIRENINSLRDVLFANINKEILISNILNKIEIYYDELLNKETIDKALNIFRNYNLIINKLLGVKKINKKTVRQVKAISINKYGQIVVKDKNNIESLLNKDEDVIEWWMDDKEA
ncbi:biotin--[acetyl-CoA-carboxylase] ligase [Sedimentibacter sp. zth1]|uniref:biotin--[acetyl-CoA-carboxylase] ligase n=1 Tax=Sedimentibacter sp. zth1 TaxID=2816908 RepID=UPI001A91298E|nr:biotin--[acetyl-CoA-carboxylase] ligase [Sedimentibacter sp. zth1]QSX05841.1 biotin--[acetyl-CoA-carboxylase] ligase [Sedimentibacter sp. zth1]